MRSKTHKVYLVSIRVKPNKQEVTFNMAFHISLVITCQHVRIMLLRDLLFVGELFEDLVKRLDFLGIISESLVVFLIL